MDNNDGTLTPELQEEYIDLMCQVNPSQVYAYLKGAEGYRLEQTLEVSCGLVLYILIFCTKLIIPPPLWWYY